MKSSRFPIMKTTFPGTLLALLGCCLPALSFPTADDPEFKELLELPSELRFTARFGSTLLEIPAAEIPAFRESLVRDLNDKKIPDNHASRAIRLTDTHWAESDTAGFLRAIEAGLKDPHHSARLRATCLLLDSDVDAAIRTACDFGFSYGSMELFAEQLAAKDPQRAFALFTERAIDSKTAFSPVPMFLHWAETDADAAWTALNSLGENPRLNHYLSSSRTAVAAHFARRDLPTALRLIDLLDPPHAKAETTRAMIASITRDDIPAALGICRKLDTKDAWLGFARSVHTPDDRETIRILLESLPTAHRNEGLAVFFSYDDPVLPAFRNAQLIPLLKDPALRRKALLDLVETHMANAYKPMPDAVVDAALAMTADILGPATPLPQRQHLLRQMLRRDPMAVLPWILALSDAEYSSFQEDIRKAWPDERLAMDIPALLAHEHPRARAIGTRLLDDGLWSKPADVLAIAVRHAPERIAKEMNVYVLHKQMGEDFPNAEAQLREIADPAARTAALRAYALWSIGRLPPAQAKAMAQEYLQKNPKEDPKDILSTSRHAAGRGIRRRHRHHPRPAGTGQGRETRPARPRTFPQERGTTRAPAPQGHPLRQRVLLRTLLPQQQRTGHHHALGRFPRPHRRTPRCAYPKGCHRSLRPDARGKPERQAPQIVARVSNKKFRDAFSTAVALRTPPSKDADTWARAIKLGLTTDAGRTLGVKAIRIMANQDPKSAINTLLQSGPDAMRPEFVQPVMEKLVLDDPPAAFALLKSFPSETSGASLSTILSEWSRIDPQAACQAAVSLPAENAARHLGSTVESWLGQDAQAARSWIFSLPQGPARQAALTAMIQQLSSSAPHEAAELFLKEFSPPLSDSLANRIASGMSQTSYPAACQFLIGLDGKIEARRFSNTWLSILRDWSASDPDSAARFLESMPDSPFARELRTLSQGTARNTTRKQAISDPLNLLRSDTLHRQTLSEHAAADLRQAVIQPANQSTYLAPYCVYLLRRNQDAAIPKVLKDAHDLGKQQAEESGFHATPPPSRMHPASAPVQPAAHPRLPRHARHRLPGLAGNRGLRLVVEIGKPATYHPADGVLLTAARTGKTCETPWQATSPIPSPSPEEWASFLTGRRPSGCRKGASCRHPFRPRQKRPARRPALRRPAARATRRPHRPRHPRRIPIPRSCRQRHPHPPARHPPTRPGLARCSQPERQLISCKIPRNHSPHPVFPPLPSPSTDSNPTTTQS
jgi:hypothetical protein